MLSINQFVIDPSEMSVPDFVSAPHTPALSHSAQITSVYRCLSASVTCATQRGSPEVHHAAHKHMLRHCSQLILLTGCYTKALTGSDQISKRCSSRSRHKNWAALCGAAAGVSQSRLCWEECERWRLRVNFGKLCGAAKPLAAIHHVSISRQLSLTV